MPTSALFCLITTHSIAGHYTGGGRCLHTSLFDPVASGLGAGDLRDDGEWREGEGGGAASGGGGGGGRTLQHGTQHAQQVALAQVDRGQG